MVTISLAHPSMEWALNLKNHPYLRGTPSSLVRNHLLHYQQMWSLQSVTAGYTPDPGVCAWRTQIGSSQMLMSPSLSIHVFCGHKYLPVIFSCCEVRMQVIIS